MPAPSPIMNHRDTENSQEQIQGRGVVQSITFLRVAPMDVLPMRTEHEVVLLTWVIEGSWGVRDTFNNGATIFPNDLLRVAAGTGLTITEFNPSATEPASIVQLRLRPKQEGMVSGYEVRNFFLEEMESKPLLIASLTAQEGVVNSCAAVHIYVALITAIEPLPLPAISTERLVVRVEGEIVVDGNRIETVITIEAGKEMTIEAIIEGRVMVMEL